MEEYELDGRVRIALASWAPATALRVRIDREHRLLSVLRGDDALKTYLIAPTCDAPTVACLGVARKRSVSDLVPRFFMARLWPWEP